MSYASNISAETRKLNRLLVIEQDYCSLTFGSSPCLATGTKCFNTFRTCKYKTAFTKTTKEYNFCNNDATLQTTADLNARPYIKTFSHMATELREDKTIPARSTYELMDEPDTDVGIDPYLSSRTSDVLTVQGTFWKKWLERNPNYKGRIVTEYEGFEGDDFTEYNKIFEGKIESIKRDSGKVTIEVLDLLTAPEDVEYPIKLKAKITEDIGAATEITSDDDMVKLSAVKNSFAIRTDFLELPLVNFSASDDPASTLSGDIYYAVVAYDASDQPVAILTDYILDIVHALPHTSQKSLQLNWAVPAGVNISYYKVFGRTTDFNTYFVTTGTGFTDDGSDIFTESETIPETAYRAFKLIGDNPADLNLWQWQETDAIGIDDTTQLVDVPGYISIKEEIIYYSGKTSTSITGVKRIQAKSKSIKHYSGTNIAALIYKQSGNPWDHYKAILQLSDKLTGRIPTSKIDSYAAAYTGINMSTLPVFKKTNLGLLARDLMNVLDAKHWIAESGLIDFKYNSEDTAVAEISDASNIIFKSSSIDHKTEELITRIFFFYSRYDATKDLTDKNNYKHLHIEIDSDAESSFMYNEQIPQTITTTWINDNSGTPAAVAAYVAALCKNKLIRKRVIRPALTCDLELKDSAILVGQLITLASDEFNNIDGTDYSTQKFEVIKKDPKGNKFTVTLQYYPDDDIDTDQDDQIQILENPIPVTTGSLHEVLATGQKYIDAEGNEYAGTALNVKVSNVINLKCDNMYMSTAETATDINGVTRSLPKIWTISGYTSIFTGSWKTGRRYIVYMGILNKGKTAMQYARPTPSDTNGKWYIIGYMKEEFVNDAAKKYLFKYTIPITLVGRKLCFDIYYDCNLAYDADAPVQIAVGFLT